MYGYSRSLMHVYRIPGKVPLRSPLSTYCCTAVVHRPSCLQTARFQRYFHGTQHEQMQYQDMRRRTTKADTGRGTHGTARLVVAKQRAAVVVVAWLLRGLALRWHWHSPSLPRRWQRKACREVALGAAPPPTPATVWSPANARGWTATGGCWAAGGSVTAVDLLVRQFFEAAVVRKSGKDGWIPPVLWGSRRCSSF